MKIVADAYIPHVKQYFEAYGDLILKHGRTISREDVMDADILLVRSVTHVDRNLLNNTRVRFVGSVTAGADHLDTKWLDEAGIIWSVAAGFNSPPVADYVVSVIAALQKKSLLPESKVKTAIIGVGSVGQLVIERLKILNFEILMCDPIRAEKDSNFNSVPIDELSDIDLVSLHVPLTHTRPYQTYHFIAKRFLQQQRAGCILLNTSRGAVINSQELLEYGKHLHWCFDVWEHEPRIDKTILTRSLTATPHIAGYSVQSKIRGIDMIYRIACEKQIIEPKAMVPLEMPHQQLSFAGDQLHWQDIVLGIFNPFVMTSMMRSTLLTAHEYGHLFDEMRNKFNYRYEFGFTKVDHRCVADKDREMLMKLNIEI